MYSGYAGHTYRRTSVNYPSDLASAYSVDWALLGKAGLGTAVAGYGQITINDTVQALGGQAKLICASRNGATQADFTKHYTECDGAMEWFPGGLANDPGFFVSQSAAAAQPPVVPASNAPEWSDRTLGGMVFAHVTKTTAFNATDLELLQRYPIVQFDKAQDIVSMPADNQEDRFIAAARQIKSVNPKAKLLCCECPDSPFPRVLPSIALPLATLERPSVCQRNLAGT